MILKIKMEELELLREMAIATYQDTFGEFISHQDMQSYFNQELSLETLRAELENPESAYYFIWHEEQAVGYLKVNQGSAQTEQELEDAFEIQRIYILPAYQGMGFGKHLFEFALRLAEESGLTWAWLGVWEHNDKAQKFYLKYGFEKFSQHEFITGETVDIDWLLRKKVRG